MNCKLGLDLTRRAVLTLPRTQQRQSYSAESMIGPSTDVLLPLLLLPLSMSLLLEHTGLRALRVRYAAVARSLRWTLC